MLAPHRRVTCAVCGASDVFGPGWRYPPIPPENYYDRRVGSVVCSDTCERKLLAQGVA